MDSPIQFTRREALQPLLAALLAPAGALAQRGDKTLVVALPSILRQLNPAIQAAPVNLVGAQIFASPLRFDRDWTPQPYLAESWTFQDDGKSLLLRLVSGATFHDGRPITSEDVAFSIMAIKANHPFSTMLAPVERVDTPTPQLAIVRLKHEYPALLLALSPALCPIMPKHVFGDGQDLRTHPRNADPVGSGPFRLVSFVSNQQIVPERHAGFFMKDRPRVARLIFRILPDPVIQMLELERGGVHMTSTAVTAVQLEQARKMTDVRLVDKGGEAIGPVGWLEFNLRKKPFDDLRVRKAIAYAIDKDFIVRQLHRGTSQVATGPIAPGTPFFSSDKVEPYRVDLARAAKLLDDAGLRAKPDGTRFSMTLDYQPGIPDNYELIANYLKPQLRKVGIDVTVRTSPDFATWAKRVSNWEHEATMSGAFMWGDPAIGVHRTWISSNIRQGVIFSNTEGYANPKVDELFARATVERDIEKRKKLYAEFQQILSQDVPVAFTHVWSRRYAARKEVLNTPEGIWGTAAPYDQVDLA
ncbi:MAG: ABC transporter substrate-binding protein [Rubrivivax sp.]|nr:ABC transporter substrate-binding protein [Rubrivivax sp.]